MQVFIVNSAFSLHFGVKRDKLLIAQFIFKESKSVTLGV